MDSNTFTKVWHGLIHCDKCLAIIKPSEECPVCNFEYIPNKIVEIKIKGITHYFSQSFAGAIPWSIYTLLILIYREWERPNLNEDLFPGMGKSQRPSQKLLIVVLFWSLFESLMDKFFEDRMKYLPERIRNDLNSRYSSIGNRFNRLYPILFETKFSNDFISVSNKNTYDFIIQVQNIRNEFIHGNPEAINDDIVEKTIKYLEPVQKAWIALYNCKCSTLRTKKD